MEIPLIIHEAPANKMARAITLSQSGRLTEAETIFRDILRENPRSSVALHNLAICFIEQGRIREAEECLANSIAIDPHYGQAHRTLGGLLHTAGRHDEAERYLRKAIATDPADGDSWNNLGVVLNSTARFEESVALLDHAARKFPQHADVHNNLGIALMSLGRLKQARSHFKRSLCRRPEDVSTLTNLGNAYKEEGRLIEANTCYDLALAMDPVSVSTHWNRSLALLQAGDFERGWKEYEWRWKKPNFSRRTNADRPWTGDSIAGKTILLYAEQGLGDTIQFIRYGMLLKERGARVLFECPGPLLEVIMNSRVADAVFMEGEPLPPYDVSAPLMSLPWLCKTTMATVPALMPYLDVTPELETYWKARMRSLCESSTLRVGIAWQGNPHHPWDRFRSIPLEAWSAIGQMKEVQFVSLQIGPGSEQLTQFRQHSEKPEIISLSTKNGHEMSVADIAAIMAQLDLVITVDTATAHLAGALGKPTWILLAAIADWRWLTGTKYSPWYPDATLFRQRRLQDWRATFREIRRELGVLAKMTKNSSVKVA